jgi:hypothetical protein
MGPEAVGRSKAIREGYAAAPHALEPAQHPGQESNPERLVQSEE